LTLAASDDGQTWKTVLDRSQATDASPHTYIAFDAPVKARYLKLTNVSMPGGGKFAVSDLRVFAEPAGPAPAAVKELTATRDATDRRKVTLTWKPSDGATQYLIRYGIAKDKLYQPHVVRGDGETTVTLYSLNSEPPYYFRVDAISERGITPGESIAEAP
jgi:hypothetical protein